MALPLSTRNCTGIAIAGHGEDVEQLLEVRAVVLVVAPRHRQAQSSSQGTFPLSRIVVAVKSNGGRVVVQLVETDVEFAHSVGGDLERQRRDVSVKEAVEGPTDAIVIERGKLRLANPSSSGSWRAAHSPTP